MYKELIYDEFYVIKNIWDNFIGNKDNINLIEDAAFLIVNSFEKGGKVLACGNGGSHCNAMHFAEELTGRYRRKRPSYPAIAISDPCHISCVSNDFGYEYIFSRYVEAIGNKNDVLLVISTSGRSKNILRVIETACSKDIQIIALVGNNLILLPDINISICVPYVGYSDRIQEIHIKIIHILILLIEKMMISRKVLF